MPDISQYFPITDPTLIFFVVLCIILFAPIVMSRLRIPHIIGMVLAGIMVGRYGLNILERDSSFELFGKVGLLYIMFLAGLEMNLTNIRKRQRQFLVFGLLTFAIPFCTAYLVGIFRDHLAAPCLYLCLQHPHCLPHSLQVRSAETSQRRT